MLADKVGYYRLLDYITLATVLHNLSTVTEIKDGLRQPLVLIVFPENELLLPSDTVGNMCNYGPSTHTLTQE